MACFLTVFIAFSVREQNSHECEIFNVCSLYWSAHICYYIICTTTTVMHNAQNGLTQFKNLTANDCKIFKVCLSILGLCTNGLNRLTLSWRRSLSYRNQSTDLLCKSMDWFLYDRDPRHERVNIFLLLFKNITAYNFRKLPRKRSLWVWFLIGPYTRDWQFFEASFPPEIFPRELLEIHISRIRLNKCFWVLQNIVT